MPSGKPESPGVTRSTEQRTPPNHSLPPQQPTFCSLHHLRPEQRPRKQDYRGTTVSFPVKQNQRHH